MKRAWRIAWQSGPLWQPGVTTDEIDKAVHQTIIDAGAYPLPLGYSSFPKSVATSVNECICHGIPDFRPLQVLSLFMQYALCSSLLPNYTLLGVFPIFLALHFSCSAWSIILQWWHFSWCYWQKFIWGTLLQDGDIINVDVTVYLNVRFWYLHTSLVFWVWIWFILKVGITWFWDYCA